MGMLGGKRLTLSQSSALVKLKRIFTSPYNAMLHYNQLGKLFPQLHPLHRFLQSDVESTNYQGPPPPSCPNLSYPHVWSLPYWISCIFRPGHFSSFKTAKEYTPISCSSESYSVPFLLQKCLPYSYAAAHMKALTLYINVCFNISHPSPCPFYWQFSALFGQLNTFLLIGLKPLSYLSWNPINSALSFKITIPLLWLIVYANY